MKRLLLIAVLFLGACRERDYAMQSGSMEPTIKEGQVVSADMTAYENADPQR